MCQTILSVECFVGFSRNIPTPVTAFRLDDEIFLARTEVRGALFPRGSVILLLLARVLLRPETGWLARRNALVFDWPLLVGLVLRPLTMLAKTKIY